MSEHPSPDEVAIRRAAMDLLARREHGAAELRAKLLRRFASAGDVDAAIDRLTAEGLQSDRRFAEQLLRSRLERAYGPFRIRQELLQKQVDEVIVDEVLAAVADAPELDGGWEEVARRAWHKRFGTLPRAFDERQRQARYLQQRGFDHDTIRHVLEGAG